MLFVSIDTGPQFVGLCQCWQTAFEYVSFQLFIPQNISLFR